MGSLIFIWWNTFFLLLTLNIKSIISLNNIKINVEVEDNVNYNYEGTWEFKQRIGMWNVQEATDNQIIYTSDEMVNGDKVLKTITFNSWSNQQLAAVWASHYVPVNQSLQRYIITLSYYSEGDESYKIKTYLDVAYTNNKHLFAKITNEKANLVEGKFYKCVNIPAYGSVRALMIHIVLEDKIENLIHISDISIKMSYKHDVNCEVYTDTFPKERHVIPNFLVPSKPLPENAQITFATQLTIDRMPYLIETAKIWQGPISAAILVLEQSQFHIVQQIVKTYYSEECLHKLVRIHIITEDHLNGGDSTMYPVNFLRNVALKFATTKYVFLVDADISPSFSATSAYKWISHAKHNCQTCAFIFPVFHVKKTGSHWPQSKEELLRFMNEPNEGDPILEPFLGVSHSVVQYHKWYTAKTPYHVDYKEDMEPYFVVERDSPLMSDMYVGYGRDKCAYSRDLHHRNFKFLVLLEGFLLNKPNLPGSTTILHRSRGLQLRVFLTISFHLEDLKHGHVVLKEDFLSSENTKVYSKVSKANDQCSSKVNGEDDYDEAKDNIYSKLSNENMDKEQILHQSIDHEKENFQAAFETNDKVFSTNHKNSKVWTNEEINAVKSDGSFDCIYYKKNLITPSSLTDNSKNFLLHIPTDRKEILIEKLMKKFGTYTYIEVPSLATTGSLRAFIPLVHPEAVITLQHLSRDKSIKTNGVFHYYQLQSDLSESLTQVIFEHSGPATIVYKMEMDLPQQEICKVMNSFFQVLTDKDILVIEAESLNLKIIHNCICEINPNWQIFRLKGNSFDFIVLKNVRLLHHPPLKNIELPHIAMLENQPKCQRYKSEMILLTKNRPLQTMAYLESLNMFIEGLSKVWIVEQSDDNLFEEGYSRVKNISAEFYFGIEFLRQAKGNLGKEISDILVKSNSHCMIFGVDEMIWLRNHDLTYSCCLMYENENEIASVQLRLGKDLFIYPPRDEIGDLLVKSRIHPLKFDPGVFVYYPCYWPYDFGYAVHIDGLMMNKKQMLNDLHGILPGIISPGHLESTWSTNFLHVYARKWHIMFDKKLLVNNMSLKDGRVANKAIPEPESYDLCKTFLNKRKKIDVKDFAKKYASHRSGTHMKLHVEFIDY